MLITVSNLCYDTLNFFRNQFINIILLILLISLISVALGHSLSPSKEQLIILNDSIHMNTAVNMSLQQLLQQMSVEQRHILLKASAAITLASLIGNVLLVGGLLTMIRLISNYQPVSVLRAISISIPLLPHLLLLIFLTTLLIQLGLLLVIIPGIILAIAFSLAPIISTSDNLGAIKSMYLSANLAFTNLRLLVPAILFWFLVKASILLFAINFTIVSPLVTSVLLNSLNNLITALLLIYLYRLYMLLNKN